MLTVEERDELERWLAAQTTRHRDRQRAEVELLATDGVPGTQIAPLVWLSWQAVCKWRRQFLDRGLDGLVDAPRSGRSPVYGPTDRLVLMAKVTEERPEGDSQWSHSELAAASILIAASQIGHILAADDVRPHRVQGRLTLRETPEFWERARPTRVGSILNPPTNAVVLSIDEKTDIQARLRKHPPQPSNPTSASYAGASTSAMARRR